MKWDIHVDEGTVLSFDTSTTSAESVQGLRIRYRPLGSKGRFVSFVLLGDVPKGRTLVDVVVAHNDERGPAAWRNPR